ncbi:MAG: c-type cytochrome [Enhygromyxa sp.]
MAAEDHPEDHPEDKPEDKDLEVEHPESETGSVESVLAIHEPIAREKEEPRDGFEPLPTWLIFVFFALMGWGGWYLGRYTADFRSDVFRIEDTAIGAALLLATDEGPRDLAQEGPAVYQRICASCHQASGQGIAGAFPPLAASEYVVGEPETLVRIILHGVQGPIVVAGTRYSALMPGWGQQLDDFEIAAVATHVRSAFGNDASGVSEAFVAEVRKASGVRTLPWTVDELEQAEPVTLPTAPEVEQPAAEGEGAPDAEAPPETPSAGGVRP